ncbi:hypothetical protein LQZ18_00430 [Lachnospiraceae bacterium ZAX-1]
MAETVFENQYPFTALAYSRIDYGALSRYPDQYYDSQIYMDGIVAMNSGDTLRDRFFLLDSDTSIGARMMGTVAKQMASHSMNEGRKNYALGCTENF